MMNLTGDWSFHEEFDFGVSTGTARMEQEGQLVRATLSFVEEVEGDYRLNVEEQVQGSIEDGRLVLESVAVKAHNGEREVEYLGNTFDLHLSSEQLLVGSIYDEDNVHGICTFKR